MKEKVRSGYTIWWMNPTYIGLFVLGIVILGAYFIPAQSYSSYYRVTKFIDGVNIWYCVWPALCFVIGSVVASVATKGMAPSRVFEETITRRDGFMRFSIVALFALTMFGYAIWYALIVKNGFTPTLFLNVLKGEPGAIYRITENFEKMTGVTSFTNFSIPFTMLAVYYQCLRKQRTFLPMLLIVGLLTLMRSIFFSERLAILEILVPALIIYLTVRLKHGRKLPLVNAYPIIALVFLVGFFGVSEYFRSWVSYYVHVYPSFWEFMVTRFFGYYVTALNTGILYIEQLGFQSIPFPYFTLEWLWKFPGLSLEGYPGIYGIRAEEGMRNALETLGNPEFNNPSGLLLPYHDYGFAGALVFWLFVGFFSGLLYTYFQKGHTFGMIIYPIWMVGILEIPRYFYFSSGRFFPCWIVLAVFALVVHYNRKKLKSWHLAGVKNG